MHWFQLKAAATTLGRFPPSPGFPEASPVKEISTRVCLFLVFAVSHIIQWSRSNEYAVWQCKIASVFWKRVYQGFYNSELSLFWGNKPKKQECLDWLTWIDHRKYLKGHWHNTSQELSTGGHAKWAPCSNKLPRDFQHPQGFQKPPRQRRFCHGQFACQSFHTHHLQVALARLCSGICLDLWFCGCRSGEPFAKGDLDTEWDAVARQCPA